MRPSRFRDGSPRGKKRAGRRGPPPKGTRGSPVTRPRRPATTHYTPELPLDPPGSSDFARFFVLHLPLAAGSFSRVRMAASPTPSTLPRRMAVEDPAQPPDPNRSAAGRCPPLPPRASPRAGQPPRVSRPCGSIKRSRVSRAAISGTISIRADRWESGRHEAATRGGCEGPRWVSTRLGPVALFPAGHILTP